MLIGEDLDLNIQDFSTKFKNCFEYFCLKHFLTVLCFRAFKEIKLMSLYSDPVNKKCQNTELFTKIFSNLNQGKINSKLRLLIL